MRRIVAIIALGVLLVGAVGIGVLASSPYWQRRAIRSVKARPVAVRYFKWVSKSRIDAYFEKNRVRKVQIGSGNYRMPGWLNTDIEPDMDTAYLDAVRPFPFPDNSVDYIFSEQMIEHLPYADGLAMFRECHRVLRPGGKVRTSTPNLLRYVELFQKPQSDEVKNFIAEKMKFHGWTWTISPQAMILNMCMREWDHAFVYDPATLREVHEKAGFHDIREWELGKSADPVLTAIESRAVREPQFAFFEYMTFEATK